MTEIINYITNDYRAIDSLESVLQVQDFLADLNYSHFPIMENDSFIGCISAEDVETFDTSKAVINYKYTFERFFARKSTTWLEVLEVFARHQCNLVPVLDDNNLYLGYYVLEDVMTFFKDTPFLKEPGGIVIVEKEINDYSMSQVTQIVESNNGKILGCFISELSTNAVQITIKIASGSINDIIQSFRRYNYTIISEHQEDTYINNLKERSDYLDKYLNI